MEFLKEQTARLLMSLDDKDTDKSKVTYLDQYKDTKSNRYFVAKDPIELSLSSNNIDSDINSRSIDMDSRFFTQAGSYSVEDNATRVKDLLNSVGKVSIEQKKFSGNILYKVRVKPFNTDVKSHDLLSR